MKERPLKQRKHYVLLRKISIFYSLARIRSAGKNNVRNSQTSKNAKKKFFVVFYAFGGYARTSHPFLLFLHNLLSIEVLRLLCLKIIF